MEGADIFNWAPKLFIRPNEELINVKVGPAEEEYKVHRDVLTRSSVFFTNALGNNRYIETDTHTLSLPEIDPRVFPIWLDWAYNGKISSATLDVQFERMQEGSLTSQTLMARKRLNAGAYARLVTGGAAYALLREVCEEFVAQNQGPFWPETGEAISEAARKRKKLLFKKICDVPACITNKRPRKLHKMTQEISKLFDEAGAEDAESAEGFHALKVIFCNTYEAKVVAAQETLSQGPELPRDQIQAGTCLNGQQGQLEGEEQRPSFINMIRLYQVADFLLSEKCRNMVIDAVAELSCNTRYVPNALDVGELWGFDDELGTLEELLSPAHNRNLKALIRRIYCAKNTQRLILEEQDAYPELFLREISAMQCEKDDKAIKWAWASPSSRCSLLHAHQDTLPCMIPIAEKKEVQKQAPGK